MATKSFLTAKETIEAPKHLRTPPNTPDGDEKRCPEIVAARAFSAWLGGRLKNRLERHPEWIASQPVALGSWSREELSPKSDIDLLFLGPEENVNRLVQDCARQGLKLRYRVPEDPADWTKGVLPFDVLALLKGVPLTPAAGEKLKTELARLKGGRAELKLKNELLKAMRVERNARAERYDSISNFLEPNLKYGPGGLRDLEQALVTRDLFPERFGQETGHAFEVLLYYKSFFLLVRQKLHLSDGASDVLSAPEQLPISQWLGFAEPREFMKEIQKGLSRVSFYADWTIAQASSSAARIAEVENARLGTVGSLFEALETDPSILMQNRVRLASDLIFAGLNRAPKADRQRSGKVIGARLSRLLDPSTSEPAMLAFFRSRLVDHCVPDFRRIVGYVQHDQYHRFTVDAHLLQVLRELKRVRQKPSRAGRLGVVAKSLNKREWDVLAFACLYHDLAKGRGGDHARKGIDIAKRDLEMFGKDDAFIRDVCWIVEEHLALSAAAFRENPRSPRTWRTLHEKGVNGRKLSLLSVFTIVDIKGTNPDAWTPWKERLLHELFVQMDRPETNSMMKFAETLKVAKVKGWERYVESLDPFLIGSVPTKTLVEDLQLLKRSVGLAPKVVRVAKGSQTWVRFHETEDRAGLFLNYVRSLAGSGLSVRHASIHTDPELGVYDWFEVRSAKPVATIRKLLTASGSSASSAPDKRFNVKFETIEMVSSDDREWVVSFRGRDQSGALVEAARALFDEGAEILWAKVHTWGRQIDDVFGIVKREGVEPNLFIDALSRRLGSST